MSHLVRTPRVVADTCRRVGESAGRVTVQLQIVRCQLALAMTRLLAHRRVRAIGRTLAATTVLVFIAMTAGMTAATAQPSDGNGGGATVTDPGLGSQQLPVSRWASGVDQFHSRTATLDVVGAMNKGSRLSTMSFLFSAGTSMWTLSAQISEMAYRFNVLDRAGAGLDKAAAGIGHAILSSPIPVMAVGVAVLIIFWRAGRYGLNSGSWGLLLRKAVIIAIMAIMVGGANASTGNQNGGYQPGFGSPGWFVTKVDKAATMIAELPAKALSWQGIGGAEKIGEQDTQPEFNTVSSCRNYVAAMKNNYQEKYRGAIEATPGASVPILVSSMWEQSGLQTWITAQFGNNPHARYMYCRYLEAKSGIPYRRFDPVKTSDSQLALTLGEASTQESYNDRKLFASNAPAWRPLGDNVHTDRWIIAWAACRNERVAKAPVTDLWNADDKAWATTDFTRPLMKNDASNPAQDCRKFFTSADEEDYNGFDRDPDPGKVQAQISKQGENDQAKEWARDFILTTHGDWAVVGVAAGFVYVLSSIAIIVVFGVMALAVIFGKVAALLVILGVMVMMVVDLFSSGPSKTLGLLKTYFGVSLFVVGSQLLVAIVATITQILVTLGAYSIPGGPWGTMQLLWVGLSPLAAVMLVHFLFKRAGLPSPMSLNGAMGWGQAIGRSAGFMGGGLLDRTAHRGASGLANRGKGLLGEAFGGGEEYSGGGSEGRRSTRKPEGFLQRTAATALGSEISERFGGNEDKKGSAGSSKTNADDELEVGAKNAAVDAGTADGKGPKRSAGTRPSANAQKDAEDARAGRGRFRYASAADKAAAIRAAAAARAAARGGTHADESKRSLRERIGGAGGRVKYAASMFTNPKRLGRSALGHARSSLADRRTLVADGIRNGSRQFMEKPFEASKNAAKWAARNGVRGAVIAGGVGALALGAGVLPAAGVAAGAYAINRARRHYLHDRTLEDQETRTQLEAFRRAQRPRRSAGPSDSAGGAAPAETPRAARTPAPRVPRSGEGREPAVSPRPTETSRPPSNLPDDIPGSNQRPAGS